ncbi:glycosyltransferase WbuB [Longispora fulva]|uniref:Glycosyltransferase involved in cell wall biosynthesis n=1 Tax=Longispora fulva TaxID=619741 RepID=A0A8J7GG02_9ACTN|nr:glycosyltransferase family 4 protein [Longispora fulva]MBG6137126.1 glycosyltransferase involved in cell wall biosynthesis [Longispora fulva]GIG61520.1 glycosyltransferase WbuB [Longispora fulva]
MTTGPGVVPAVAAGMRAARATRPHVLLVVENVPLARDARLRRQARALLAAGYRVTVICPRDPGNASVNGVRVLDYRPAPDNGSTLGFVREYAKAWLATAWLIGKLLVTDRFDVVQITSTPDIFFTVTAPLRTFTGTPVLLDQRDQSPELYELRFGRRGPVHRLLLWLERASYRSADQVLAVNRTAVDLAVERGGIGRHRVTVVGNGPALASTGPRAVRPELRGRRYLCCWHGAMGPQDQLDLAVRVVHHVVRVDGRTDCQFVFLGDGDARAGAERLAGTLGVDDWVTFTGWVGQEEVFDHLATADLGFDSNLEDIVSPVKGMEYMAFGLPFVAFDARETRSAAGPSAVYAHSGDAGDMARLIGDLLDDPDRRADMGRTGRLRIEVSFAWERQQESYLRVVRGLLAGRST